MSPSWSVRGTGFLTACGLIFAQLAACGSDTNAVLPPATLGGGGASAGTGSSAVAGGGTTAAAGSGVAGSGMAGSGVAGMSAGGSAGMAGAGGGSAGASGSAGSGGTGGGAGAGTCSPDAGPGAGMKLTTTGWKAQWSVECNFQSNNGNCDPLKPENAFDGKGDTRTSLGDTHKPTAQVVGDAFTFDMQGCKQLGKLLMFSAAPPNNQGSFDTRDFPGSAKVTVSTDCTTSADGKITGTFGAVVATANEAEPGCGNCKLPMTINFQPSVAAKCVKIELTKVLQLGASQPGIWWAIDELQAFAP